MKIRIGNKTYSPLYKFDGGEYYTEDNAVSAEAWLALMDDGTLKLLIDGKHIPYDAKYEIIQNDSVTVICYNSKQVWDSRASAIEFYRNGFLNSDGIERERYSNILLDLMDGKAIATDSNK